MKPIADDLTPMPAWINVRLEAPVAFLIHVFNTVPIEEIHPQEILEAITESNYHTLCSQYGLAPDLIDETRASLRVLAAPEAAAPFLMLAYRPGTARPILVHFQEQGEIAERLPSAPERARKALSAAVQIVSIELDENQLQDLGLLLGYELARWAAVRGKGVVLGLDGRWYRLNASKAFLPIETAG